MSDELICSRRGCRAKAEWSVQWNNPTIHTPERRKNWLACEDHRAYLEQYLAARQFWKQTIPIEELTEQ